MPEPKSNRISPPSQRPKILLTVDVHDPKIRTIAEVARDWGWNLIVLGLSNGVLPQDMLLRGALIIELPGTPLAERLREIGCPAVRLGNMHHPEDALLPVVLPDRRAAGHLAAEHFAERQFKNVGFVGHEAQIPGNDWYEMFEGFRIRSEELGMTFHFHDINRGRVSGEPKAQRNARRAKALLEWISGLPKPIGIFTFADGSAMKICQAFQAAGYRIPEEIGILSNGNEIFCELAPVSLSAVDTGNDDIAREAMQVLRGLMAGEPPPSQAVMVPPKGIVERLSTDLLAVEDQVVHRALRFMWTHVGESLTVEDVVRESGVSHSTLQRRFHRSIGRGIIAEFRRKRLELACELLRDTDMTVAEIARSTDFRSNRYLHQVFRDAFEMTPRKYRLKFRA